MKTTGRISGTNGRLLRDFRNRNIEKAPRKRKRPRPPGHGLESLRDFLSSPQSNESASTDPRGDAEGLSGIGGEVRKFEQASGWSVQYSWSQERIGELVRLLLARPEEIVCQVEHARDVLTAAATHLASGLARLERLKTQKKPRPNPRTGPNGAPYPSERRTLAWNQNRR